MDKGQHLRLFIVEGSSNNVIAMSTELSLHGSAQTENSTTKDTTDSSGAVWDENDVVDDHNNLWPIPNTFLDKLQNAEEFGQNPGYDPYIRNK